MPTAVEITGFHPGGVNVYLGDGSVRFTGQNNLQDMVRSITTQTSPNSIDVLRITSPGIIAILIGLLLPAVSKVREAAAQPGLRHLLPGMNKLKETTSGRGLGNLLPTNTWAGKAASDAADDVLDDAPTESANAKSLSALRPYFAHGAQVELRAEKGAFHDLNSDGLTELAKLFGVPVLIGVADAGGAGWQGPVIKATPHGMIQKV